MGEIKPSFDTNRQILGKIMPIKTPFTVILDSSEVCNFKCRYCFRSDKDKSSWGYAVRNDFMSWDVFEKVVAQMKEFPDDIKQISLSNQGEPLCNKRLPEMIRYIKKENLKGRISLHTNASLLTKDMALDLADSNPGRVVISLQGMSSEMYKKVCGYDLDFANLVNCIRVFFENKKDTELSIKIMNTALKGKAEEQMFYEIFQPISDRVFVEQAVPIWKNIKVDTEDNNLAYNKYGMGFKYQSICPLIFHTIVVAPNGEVYACTQLDGTKSIGNVLDKSLVDIWTSEERKRLLYAQLDDCCCSEECVGCGIKQNTIYSEADMLDPYKDEIKMRLQEW